MNKTTASILERVARTFVVAFVGALALSGFGASGVIDMSLLQKAALAGLAAVLSLVLSLLGTNIGNPVSPSLLPAALDPATPGPVVDDLPGRVAALEEQTPALADLQSALSQAVVAGLQHGKAKPDRATTGRFVKADPPAEPVAPAKPAEPGPVAGVDYPVRD